MACPTGIFGEDSYEPLYQNRAHYVSSGYATQWKALDSWWEEHGWAICQLLEPEATTSRRAYVEDRPGSKTRLTKAWDT